MLIAEIGWNFLGDLEIAYKMINKAKQSGATHVKFQIWDPKYLKKGPWDKDGRREIYKKAQITINIYKKLLDYSQKKKIKCFVSICTLRDLKKITKIQNDLIKIPSMESHNHKLIDFALNNFKIVIVSVGALRRKELISLTKYSSTSNFFVAHCVSSYPMFLKNFKYNKFKYLKENFKNFGYSGHYDGIDDAIFALSNGATFIEKHFTIDKSLPGRDNKFALLPNDFIFIKKYMNNIKLMKRKSNLELLKCEEEAHKIYRGRWS